MIKELEALNKIAYSYGYDENIKIIATALKEYELMKQAKIIVADKKISDDDLEKLKNQSIIVGNLEQSKIEPLFDNKTQNELKRRNGTIMRYFINDTQVEQDEFINKITDELNDISLMYSREAAFQQYINVLSSLLKDKYVQLGTKLFKIKIR